MKRTKMTAGLLIAIVGSTLLAPLPAQAATSATCYGQVFAYGSSSTTCVRYIQKILSLRDSSLGAIDGVYGAKTAAAVSRLQRGNGLTDDGIVGPATWRTLCIPFSGSKYPQQAAGCPGA